MKVKKRRWIFSKKRKKGGFSLVELLAALLIMALLAVLVSTSVNAAVVSYRKNVFVSESEVLASTVNTAMSDILCYAKYVTENNNHEVVFINANYQIVVGGHFFLNNGYICYLPYEGDPTDKTMLVSSGAYTSLYIKDLSVEFQKDSADEKSYSGIFNVSYTICSKILPGAEKKVSCSYRSLVGQLSDIG